MKSIKELIIDKKTALGIELGSTRIKAVLIDECGKVLALGCHDWENSFIDGMWTYSLDEIHRGIKTAYTSLRKDVEDRYGITPKSFGAIGISAMMHGYMAFDKNANLLTAFKTWRNSNTQVAADILTERFNYNIPLRWSIAHLYQNILEDEAHLKQIDYVTTLSAYIHRILTGERLIGIGDAAGMFPVNPSTMDYEQEFVDSFDKLIETRGYNWKLRDILPRVMVAGEQAGVLTGEGADFLDESGNLEAGVMLCPPEGDAGTGMVATNSVDKRAGNVSVGTSTFAMIVLEEKLKKLHREIDIVTTPDGSPVAMSHANNGTSDLNAWVNIFGEFARLMGLDPSKGELFEKLYTHSLDADPDCGGLLAYGYLSGEGITMLNEGRPLFARSENADFTLANFIRSHLYTSLGAVKLGLDILTNEENVKIDRIMGHGGFFKTKDVGQRCLSAAMKAPVSIMDTASEGGAWGIALLAAYMLEKHSSVGNKKGKNKTLGEYLQENIFANMHGSVIKASQDEIDGFERFMERYKKGIEIEKKAVEIMTW